MGILFASGVNKLKNNPLKLLLLSAVGFVLIACSDPDVLPDVPVDRESKEIGVYDLWSVCHDNKEQYAPPSLEDWVKKNTAIFIGKAVERRLNFVTGHKYHFNGCWVRFKTDEILKGSIGKDVWVKAIYNYNSSLIDIFDYKNCPIVAGKKYLIVGQYVPVDEDGFEFVHVDKDISVPSLYTCAPVEQFPKAEETFKKIKKIINGGETL